jgi:hypothetical protein
VVADSLREMHFGVAGRRRKINRILTVVEKV